MNGKDLITEEKRDFLAEMMNIGMGGALGALSQLIQSPVDAQIPKVDILSVSKTQTIFGDPSLPFVGAGMEMVGDVTGYLFCLVSDQQKKALIELVEKAQFGRQKKGTDLDLSVLCELSNILAGVFLRTIHDFCKLNIYHTVPTLQIDMVQSLLDGAIINIARRANQIIMFEVVFIAVENRIKIYFLVIPTVESVQILSNSIEGIKKSYGFKQD